MSPYYDTSCLVKLYIPEEGSERMVASVLSAGKALLFTPLHETELRNAIALKTFRGDIAREQMGALLMKIENDVLHGRLIRPVVDWNETYARANELSLAYTVENGCITLDILHVAMASVMGCETFITNDVRQRSLANSIGMHTSW